MPAADRVSCCSNRSRKSLRSCANSFATNAPSSNALTAVLSSDANSRRSRCMSEAVGYRSSGLTARARMQMRSRSAGTPDFTSLGLGISPCETAYSTCASFAPFHKR